MHAEARQFVAEQVERHGPFTFVVEIGSRDINGGVRDLFGDARYLGVDARPGPGVDVVADGATLTLDDEPDCIVCCEVLEHAADPAAIVANAISLLAPRGRLIITCATDPRAPHSAFDGGPLQPAETYANIQPDDLAAWIDPLVEVEIRVDDERGDLYATGRTRAR